MNDQIPEDLAIQDGDSNEVCTAKYMLQVAWLLENQHPNWLNVMAKVTYEGATCAYEVLDARE